MNPSYRAYTGIGSRKTPPDVLSLMTKIAQALQSVGMVLRSGAADGADTAFEDGAGALKEIFLPWRGFSGRQGPFVPTPKEAFELAATLHPAWERLGSGPRALHARNCNQVLGQRLDSPSELLICWTPDGVFNSASRTKESGGTATAVVLAARSNVPVFNLKNANHRNLLAHRLANEGLSVAGLAVEEARLPEQSNLF